MALKPTIYKFKIALADLNHDHFANFNLTLAQHPSETMERMAVRLLAFCLHAHDDQEQLMAFTKGLSAIDEPDIWLKGLDDQLHCWIDVGEPAFDRIKKACRLSKRTLIYSFNSKCDVWWKQSLPQFESLSAEVRRFYWTEIQTLSATIARTSEWTITLSGQSIYVASNDEQLEINWQILQ
ncbi:MAG: YaeQ family protein [Paraglaciecola sp.]|uniref:YaeQ family protein n=1 Tax=Paraglaciecola sp. TaxID=1920173 RepID=UPI00273F4FC8|nr:YaeQ family protein [Paraglaciecola sp.]MDP5032458.1 YaeQ family protein [Paraglaciecola sp.]MDP5130636.1 YaeQ family protein [Paraglaciecola sp.]